MEDAQEMNKDEGEQTVVEEETTFAMELVHLYYSQELINYQNDAL